MLYAHSYFSLFGMMATSINIKLLAFYSLISNLLSLTTPNYLKYELFRVIQQNLTIKEKCEKN